MLLVLLVACLPTTGTVDAVTSDVTDLEQRVAALEGQAEQAQEDLEAALLTVGQLQDLVTAQTAELDALQERVGELEQESTDAGLAARVDVLEDSFAGLILEVEELQGARARAWSVTEDEIADPSSLYSWTSVASVTLDLEHTGPILAWCQLSTEHYGEDRMAVRVSLTDAAGSTTTGPSLGDTSGSVGGFDRFATAIASFTPTSAGAASLSCQGYGGYWASATVVAVQVAE